MAKSPDHPCREGCQPDPRLPAEPGLQPLGRPSPWAPPPPLRSAVSSGQAPSWRPLCRPLPPPRVSLWGSSPGSDSAVPASQPSQSARFRGGYGGLSRPNHETETGSPAGPPACLDFTASISAGAGGGRWISRPQSSCRKKAAPSSAGEMPGESFARPLFGCWLE